MGASQEATYRCPRTSCAGSLGLYTGTMTRSPPPIELPRDPEERPRILEPDDTFADHYEAGLPYMCDRCGRVFQHAVYKFG